MFKTDRVEFSTTMDRIDYFFLKTLFVVDLVFWEAIFLIETFPFFETNQFQTSRASSKLERIAAQQLGRTIGHTTSSLTGRQFSWGWRLPCRNSAGVQLGWSFVWQDSKVTYLQWFYIYLRTIIYRYNIFILVAFFRILICIIVSIIYPTTYISQFIWITQQYAGPAASHCWLSFD